MRWFTALVIFYLTPLFYSLPCCNITESDGSGYSTAALNIATSTAAPNSATSLSVCLWVRPSADEDYDVLDIVSGESSSTILYMNTKQVRLYSEEAPLTLPYTSPLPVNQSSYLCVTLSSTALSVYVNGELSTNGTGLSLGQEGFTGNVYIGKQFSASNLSLGGLVGSLCGVSAWNSDLTASDIGRLYSGNVTEGVLYETTDEEGEVTSSISPVLTWDAFQHYNYSQINTTQCFVKRSHGIRLGSLDPVASKFVILFLVIIGVVFGFAGLFMCSEREIAIKRANKRLKEDHDNYSIDNASTHSVT